MKSKRTPATDLENIIPLLIGAWRRFNKLSGPADKLQTREFRGVVAAVMKLQKGLEKGEELIGQDYFADRDLLGAYLLYQWIIHYQQGLSLIGEIPNHSIGRVLDIGSGPSPFAFAALRHGARDVIALDRNLTALQLGAEVCGRYGYPVTIRRQIVVKDTLPEGQFDLIILGHCLNELFPLGQTNQKESMRLWIKGLLNKLTPTGHLLIVDSSLPHINRRILELRDYLVKENVPVQAPCVWKGECPALQAKDSPCYAQRELDKPYIVKEIQRAAQINASSLKMSYLLLKSPEANWPYLEENENCYRIISPPIEGHAGKRFYLCGTDGKRSLGSHVKEHTKDSKAFEYLKRGELITIEEPLERGPQFDIVLGTRIKIKAALGKPID